MEEVKRWRTVSEWGFLYIYCPYCNDKQKLYNDTLQQKQKYCPNCNKRVYARDGLIINQP